MKTWGNKTKLSLNVPLHQVCFFLCVDWMSIIIVSVVVWSLLSLLIGASPNLSEETCFGLGFSVRALSRVLRLLQVKAPRFDWFIVKLGLRLLLLCPPTYMTPILTDGFQTFYVKINDWIVSSVSCCSWRPFHVPRRRTGRRRQTVASCGFCFLSWTHQYIQWTRLVSMIICQNSPRSYSCIFQSWVRSMRFSRGWSGPYVIKRKEKLRINHRGIKRVWFKLKNSWLVIFFPFVILLTLLCYSTLSSFNLEHKMTQLKATKLSLLTVTSN